jgi:hypothetical protein
MKYLDTREIYLKTINETFTNEITFGGSLLGRLVNSIIRKAKVEINYKKINSIAEAIQIELNGLITNGLNDEAKLAVSKITAHALLEEIYKVSHSTESDKNKIQYLLDFNKKGLITQSIDFLKYLPDGIQLGKGDKNELVSKLEKYKKILEQININDLEEDTTEETPKEDNSEKINELLEIIIKMNDLIDKSKPEHMSFNDWLTNVQDKEKQKEKLKLSFVNWSVLLQIWNQSGIINNIDNIKKIISNKDINELNLISTEIKNKSTHLLESTNSSITESIIKLAESFFKLDDNEIQKFDSFGNLITSFNTCYKTFNNKKFEGVINYFIELINENNTNVNTTDDSDDIEETTIEDDEDNELETTKGEQIKNNSTVIQSWFEVFKENEENEWRISSNEVNKVRDMVESANFEINLVDDDSKDRIIKITNLFGRAYRLYTSSVIPSGRPGGRVSNKTFREYIHLGTGSPGTPENPGSGPWANKKIYDGFSSKISSYIEDNMYKKIFNYGKIKRTDGKALKGNVLLEFIRDMIDETALKSFDKRRSEFLNKYFGLEGYTYKEPDGVYGVNSTKSEHSESDETLQWQSINNITTNNSGSIQNGTFIAFNVKFKLENKTEDHKVIIGQVLQIKGGKILLRWVYDNEAILHAYAGAKLTHGYSYTTTDLKKTPKAELAPKESMYIGLIDLNIKNVTKTSTGNDIETEGIKPNHIFFMASKDITKPDNNTDYNYHRVHYFVHNPKLGVVNRTIKNPISVLVKTDKEGNKKQVIGSTDKVASTSIIPNDKKINIDEIIDQLESYTQRNKNKI